MPARRWMSSSTPSTGRCGCSPCSTSLVVWSNALLLFSVGAVGIWLWLQGIMSPGALAVALGLVMRFQGMSQWVMWEMSALFENIGTVKRRHLLHLAAARRRRHSPTAKPIGTVKGDIKFENVGFHYGKASGVIEGLNLHIRPGEKIGLVGRSGAGKSTIVNLLLRFYDRESGRILIDGTRHRHRHPGFAARQYRRGHAGYLAAAPLGPREHRLWPPRRDRGRYPARRRPGRSLGLHRNPERSQGPQGSRRPCRRARRQALGRPAPAHRHRPRAAQERPDPGAGRSHLRPR